MWGAEERKQRRQRGSRFSALSCLIAEALIDKIQRESTSHHFILQERNLSISCIVKHTREREIKEFSKRALFLLLRAKEMYLIFFIWSSFELGFSSSSYPGSPNDIDLIYNFGVCTSQGSNKFCTWLWTIIAINSTTSKFAWKPFHFHPK